MTVAGLVVGEISGAGIGEVAVVKVPVVDGAVVVVVRQ